MSRASARVTTQSTQLVSDHRPAPASAGVVWGGPNKGARRYTGAPSLEFRSLAWLAEVVVLIPLVERPIPLPKFAEPPREPRLGLPCKSRHRILHPARDLAATVNNLTQAGP